MGYLQNVSMAQSLRIPHHSLSINLLKDSSGLPGVFCLHLPASWRLPTRTLLEPPLLPWTNPLGPRLELTCHFLAPSLPLISCSKNE